MMFPPADHNGGSNTRSQSRGNVNNNQQSQGNMGQKES